MQNKSNYQIRWNNGESQMVEKTRVWYLSITESRSSRAVVITWCCYNRFCPPCVTSQASSSSFSRAVAHEAWAVNFQTLPDIDRFQNLKADQHRVARIKTYALLFGAPCVHKYEKHIKQLLPIRFFSVHSVFQYIFRKIWRLGCGLSPQPLRYASFGFVEKVNH